MSAHSEKGPSSSERWINCTPSAKLCADMPDVSTSFAQEGTDAHEVCEYELKKALGQKMAHRCQCKAMLTEQSSLPSSMRPWRIASRNWRRETMTCQKLV